MEEPRKDASQSSTRQDGPRPPAHARTMMIVIVIVIIVVNDYHCHCHHHFYHHYHYHPYDFLRSVVSGLCIHDSGKEEQEVHQVKEDPTQGTHQIETAELRDESIEQRILLIHVKIQTANQGAWHMAWPWHMARPCHGIWHGHVI